MTGRKAETCYRQMRNNSISELLLVTQGQRKIICNHEFLLSLEKRRFLDN